MLFKRCTLAEKTSRRQQRNIDVVLTLSYKRSFNVGQSTLCQRSFTNVESKSINQPCFHVESTFILVPQRYFNVIKTTSTQFSTILDYFLTSN